MSEHDSRPWLFSVAMGVELDLFDGHWPIKVVIGSSTWTIPWNSREYLKVMASTDKWKRKSKIQPDSGERAGPGEAHRGRPMRGRSTFFFSCIAGRVRDMVGQLLEFWVGKKEIRGRNSPGSQKTTSQNKTQTKTQTHQPTSTRQQHHRQGNSQN